MKWYAEIKLVGFRDWCWWVFYLKRNEFSYKLSLFRWYKKKNNWVKLSQARNRAHRLEELLGE